jgi:NTE family protein
MPGTMGWAGRGKAWVMAAIICLAGLWPHGSSMAEQRVGLALGSGGAAGLAHIAILKAFDESGRRPSRIAGTSIGAVIGVLYAAGLDGTEIEAVFSEFRGSGLAVLSNLASGENGLSLTDLLDFDLDNGGLLKPDGFLEFLAKKIKARNFADLKIPMSVVATNYVDGRAVVLDQGDLFEALRASIALPGLFPPVVKGDLLLLDGGISNPLPWDLLRDDVDFVVAVDVSGSREPPDQGSVPVNELIFKSFELMQQAIIEARRAAGEPDLYLRPDCTGVRLLHFHRINEIMGQAEPAAERLRQALSSLSPP